MLAPVATEGRLFLRESTAMSKSKPPAKPPRHGEDRALWEHVATSVTPLKGKRKTAKAASTPPAVTKPSTTKTATKAKAAAKQATPQRATRDIGQRATPAIASKAPPAQAGFDRATETKLRKGQLAIEGRIDLHGMTQDEAHRALSRFVSRAYAQGKRTLLVITGKGRVSQGGGVLRRLLPLWVCAGDMKTQVLAVTPAAQKDGGEGAFYLRLRKSRD